MITQERLKEVIHYEPTTGIFTWLKSLSNRTKVGDVCGCPYQKSKSSPALYIEMRVDKKLYNAHRLAFLYMTGEMPVNHVDHIDGDGLNNSWNNLRDVTSAENRKNTKLSQFNTSGFNGVQWDSSRNKWASRVQVQGKNIHLGRYVCIIEAIAARKAANDKYGFHPNHGSIR